MPHTRVITTDHTYLCSVLTPGKVKSEVALDAGNLATRPRQSAEKRAFYTNLPITTIVMLSLKKILARINMKDFELGSSAYAQLNLMKPVPSLFAPNY